LIVDLENEIKLIVESDKSLFSEGDTRDLEDEINDQFDFFSFKLIVESDTSLFSEGDTRDLEDEINDQFDFFSFKSQSIEI